MSVPELVRSLYLPVGGSGLLVPLAVVVEVVEDAEPTPLPEDSGTQQPGWVVGTVTWRGCAVPLCSPQDAFSPAPSGRCDEALEPGSERGRIAVLRTVAEPPSPPFLGVLIHRAPQMLEATQDSVQWLEPESEPARFTLGRVSVDGREAWIPDLEALGRALAGTL